MGNFSETVARFALASLAKAEMVRCRIIYTLFTDIIKDTPVDSGRLTANWLTSQGSPNLSTVEYGHGGPNNNDSERAGIKTFAIGLASDRIGANLGDGTKRNTSTYLSNSAVDKMGEAYGWKAEYGYARYGWQDNGGPPPSQNVKSDGFSRHAPFGMVRINVGRIGYIVRRSVRTQGGTPA